MAPITLHRFPEIHISKNAYHLFSGPALVVDEGQRDDCRGLAALDPLPRRGSLPGAGRWLREAGYRRPPGCGVDVESEEERRVR